MDTVILREVETIQQLSYDKLTAEPGQNCCKSMTHRWILTHSEEANFILFIYLFIYVFNFSFFVYVTFIFFNFNFYCYSITVVCLFSPSLHPTPTEHPSLPPPPPWFCPCVLYSSSCNPLSPLSPPNSPLAIVRLLLTSMTLVIFYLLFSFVDYVPVKGEIIWYLSLTAWLISLSIMLSSSIHAVAKGISSFFLSAV